MEEQLKALMDMMTAMKAGQEIMKEEMKAGQEMMKEEMKAGQEEMKAGQEEMKAGQEGLKADFKAAQDDIKADFKAAQDELRAGQELTSAAIADLKTGLELTSAAIADLKTGQELTSAAVADLKAGQETTSSEVRTIQKQLEAVKADIAATVQEEVAKISNEEISKILEVKAIVTEDKLSKVLEEKINVTEENLSKFVKNEVAVTKEKLDILQERLEEKKLDVLQERLDKLEKKIVIPALGDSQLHYTVPNISPNIKLSTYDGKTSWNVYKTQFDMISSANKWDDLTSAIQLAASLRGEAADVLQSIEPTRRSDLNMLVNALELRFGENYLKDYNRIRLKTRKQKATESLQELALDIERLSQLAFPDCPADVRDNLSLQYFVDAVKDPEIQQALRIADIKDIKSALVQAMKIEAAQQASTKERRVVRGVELEGTQESVLKRLTERMDRLEKGVARPAPYQRPHNQKLKCWLCNREGHLRKQCTRRMPKKEETPFKVFQISSLHGGDHGVFVEGEISGLPCRMIIDTGADATIVRTDVAQRLDGHLLYTAPSVSLQTVTGDKISVLGKLKVNIKFLYYEYEHVVYVADISDPCILGLDFLKKYNCSLDLKCQQLQTGNEDIPLFEVTKADSHIQRIIATEDIRIPARTEYLAAGKTEFENNFKFGITDFPSEKNIQKDLLVAKTLVDLSKNVVPVRIVNISDKPRVIQKGEEIASCAAVTCISQGAKVTTPTESGEQLLNELFKDTSLNSNQKKAATDLIKEFSNIFSASSCDVGRTKVTQHRIDTGNHAPIKQHPRRLPFAKQEEVGRLVSEMRQNNIIEPSSSPWASPIVLVRKKDGSTRFCVDYRRLNDITKKDSYPLPRIDDTLDTLSGNKWFSTLDLKSGYWQVEIHPEDREKTAFTTGQGLWQFKVMPFGLCNAPATFERLMETVLHGLTYKSCLVYLDDIIIIGRTFQEHLDNIRKVLIALREANLKLSPSKCKFFQREVKYLGHIISSEGVRTDPEKINAVSEWCRPQNVHQLRSFLGLCTYYRRFVKGFSKIARPLHRLTEGKQKFLWTADCEAAFKELKSALTSAPILAYPEPDKNFILDTDASKEGIGAVLSQEIDGQERVVAYFSKSLNKAERNYCVTRKELLAIVKAVEHFHHYLYGRKFTLRTDHASLAWLLNFKNPEGQVARWIQRLQEYDMKIYHRKGTLHKNADALSRRPCSENCQYCSKAEEKYGCKRLIVRQINATSVTSNTDTWSDDNIRQRQLEDQDLKPIIDALETTTQRPDWQNIASHSPATKRYWALWDSLHMRNGVLYRLWESDDGKNSRWQMIVPRAMIKDILKEIHSSPTGGHFGVTKTLGKVRERFYWNNSKSDVEKWCKSCNDCNSRKGPKTRTRGRLQRYNVGAPFERIALDILGPLPRTTHGNKYILVVMDYFTKWPEAYPVPDQEASTVAEALLNNWVTRFGVPLLLHSDQGTNFNSAVFKGLCELLHVEKTRTTPLHPQSDGMVERFNRTILNHLSLFVSKNQMDWDEKLPLFLLAYRSAVHETTGFTPAQLLFGRDLRLPCDLIFGKPPDAPSSPEQYLENLQARLEDVHRFARERINIATEKMKTRYDVKATGPVFREGDKVWLWNPKRRRGLSPKLQTSWEGPYTVVKKINDVVYRIQKTNSCKPRVVHYDRLAAYSSDAV